MFVMCGMCVIVLCIDNNIGDVGAQYIGDGLKSLTSLTTLNLNGGRCAGVCLCVLIVCIN